MTTTSTASPPVAAPIAGAIVARDFPGWLPPMLVKELRQGLRTRGFVGTLVGFQLVMLVFTLIALSTQNAATPSARMAGAAFTGFFWMIVAVQLLFVTPSRALGGLQQEVETRTLDLIMLTRLTAWRVVLGKWVSLLAQAVLLLVAMMPYLVVRYFTDNADLVQDVGRCLGMLGICAVLTAAGLWGSGVAKLVRVLMAIALGLVLVNLVGMLGPLFSGRPGPARGPFANAFEMPFDLLNAVLLAAFFLVSAVRNIAPPAENHSLFARLLPLIALLPAPCAEAFGAHALAVRQLFLAAGFLGFVLMFELGAGREPMPTHWRDWYRRSRLSRVVGRFALPGWPSAFIFGIVVTAAWAASAWIILTGATPNARTQAQHAAWVALLAFSGITFPAVLQSWMRAVPAPRVLIYFTGLGVPALLSGVALWLAESRWKFTGFKTVMEAMPFSSFLFGLNKTDPAPMALAAQGMVAVIVLGMAAWQSRTYWRRIASFEEKDRAATNTGAAPQ